MKKFSSFDGLLSLLEDCRQCEIKYRIKKMPKKGGSKRIIHVPSKEVKEIQWEILDIVKAWQVDECQFGFSPGKSCVDNALFHIHGYDINASGRKIQIRGVPRWVLKTDIEDAFPSVKRKHLETLFRDLFLPLKSYPAFVSATSPDRVDKIYKKLVYQFARLATFKGRMPQGSPCSPYLFNLVLLQSGIVKKLKDKAGERAKKTKGCQVTAYKISFYGDDITVTSFKDRIPNRFIKEISAIVEEGGIFRLNNEKTQRSSKKYRSILINGITLNDKWKEGGPCFLGLSKKIRKTYRGKIHRVTVILDSGRLPELEIDGINLEKAMGIISRIKDVYRNESLPSDLERVLIKFQEARNNLIRRTINIVCI
ncbi:MAG: hypothetical protein HY764_00595 [Candidatus Portnoybacteria bacterium]|nr:hypothetical protein [Candidatus Portnoybacteria bacterium]